MIALARQIRLTACAAVVALLGLSAPSANAAEELPENLEGVGVTEQLGVQLDTSLAFVDHNGRPVTLAEYFDGERPVLFTLNYYSCPQLCGVQLNALTSALKRLDWAPGENFRVVTLSFDPTEGYPLAAAKRWSHLESLGRGEVDWTFLTGSRENIDAVAAQFGYRFNFVEEQGEFAHPAALMFLTGDGRVSRYLYGMYYEERDLRLALLEAGEGKIGSPVDHFVMNCYMYDPASGSYVKDAMLFMRMGGVITLASLCALLAVLWHRERSKQASSAGLQPVENT